MRRLLSSGFIAAAALVVLAALCFSETSAQRITTEFPDARGVLARYFSAVATKDVDASLRLFTPNATISVMDYGCHLNMNLTTARTYFNSSSVWYSLLQRTIGESVQSGPIFAAAFTDAGFVPQSMQSQGGWYFLMPAVAIGSQNAFGELTGLWLHMDFLTPSVKAPYIKTVEDFFGAYCTAQNMSAAAELFEFANTTVVVSQRHTVPESYDSVDTMSAVEYVANPWAASTGRCTFAIDRISAGCSRAVAQVTMMVSEDATKVHTAQRGFFMFQLTPDFQISRLEITVTTGTLTPSS